MRSSGILRNVQLVDEAFGPLIGQQCWNVKCGYGSFVTFEFGQPHLETYRREWERPQTIAGESVMVTRRVVVIRGDWHLRIDCCFWRLFLNGREALWSEDERSVMRPVLDALSGARLVTVEVDETDGGSRFVFDLGWVLETSPYESAISVERLGPDIATEWTSDGPVEQWVLHEPSGITLTIDNHGALTHEPADRPGRELPSAPGTE